MIVMDINKDAMGIYVPKNKTFYYLETGGIFIGNTVDRIKKTLIQRALINVSIDGSPSDYKIFSYKVFTSTYPEYAVKPIFLSKHIESAYNEGTSKKVSPGLFKD
jgi:hypothetical protein